MLIMAWIFTLVVAALFGYMVGVADERWKRG